MKKEYFRESAGAVSVAIDLIATLGNPADWLQAAAGGQVVFKDGGGATVTIASAGAGDVFPGPIRGIESSAGVIRYGTGPLPIPGPTAAAGGSAAASAISATAAATSATAAASSATAAATSASAAATSATTATTQATNAAASAVTAALAGLTLSTTVITADPGPGVIGTMYSCDPSGGAFNLTLPAIGPGNANKRIGINVATTSAHAVTPVPNGTDTLPGGLASVAGTYGFAILQADNLASPKAWRRVG